jgi:hypothetical protein
VVEALYAYDERRAGEIRMNRRGFIGSLAVFAAQCTLDPEFALWTPGARTFFIPDRTVRSAEDYYSMQSAWESNAEAIARQIEASRPTLESMMIMSSVLWNKIQVSNGSPIFGHRPARIPISL